MVFVNFRHGAGGAILVLVLVTLLLLSTVVLHVTQQAVTVAEDHIFLAQSAQAALQAEATRDLVVALVATGPSPERNGAPPASTVWKEGDLRITILPVNAKLNLNALRRPSGQPRTRQALEQAVALLLAEQSPEGSMEDILDWITPEEKNGSAFARSKTDSRYEHAAYKPRRAPLERPEELLLVHGFETLDPAWIREHFTVWTQDDRVNLNAASQAILLALLPELKAHWPAINRYRSEQGFTRPDELLTRIRLPMDVYQRVLPRISLDSDVFEALVEIRLPAWYEQHRFILEREPLNEDAPVRVLAADVLEAHPLRDSSRS